MFNARPARILSVLMLIAIANVYVFANGAVAASSKAVLGKLVTTSNRPVLVNGGEAITGSVIVSGARLVTSAANLATVELSNVGMVRVAPNSDVALNFDSKSVTVTVNYGDATVSTADGVTGKIVDAAGKPRTAAPVSANTARNWGIAGVAIGSAAFIWAIVGWNKANDADDKARAAQASADALSAQLALLRACLAKQTTSPLVLCTSF
jgi:hypothetical protein